ncbi:hypothetical protein [Alcaligenes faecalis]|uniref:hypothetical protein n=1 Tax=Alcaligenes faecalis TaxID=511 RepID=UPI00208F36DF|nr:hypothetical protein [Alcaligenes faecalis]USP49139.1 hypothetical protein J5J84_06485 [Alcaligenes faecalis]
MSSSTIDDRVVLLIKDQMARKEAVKAREVKTSLLEKLLPGVNHVEETLSVLHGGRGFWKALAEGTGISADRWRKVFERKQRPTTDILAAIGARWPQHAFWVMTGITDAVNGHIAPTTATTYPERAHVSDQPSTDYFRASIALNEQLFNDDHVKQIKFEDPIDLIERTCPFAHYWEGAIANTAYAHSNTESYRILMKLWQQRETQRERHKKLITQQKNPTENGHPILGEDPRTSHQSKFYLFYEPRHDDTKD